jgi:hypothetical protein
MVWTAPWVVGDFMVNEERRKSKQNRKPAGGGIKQKLKAGCWRYGRGCSEVASTSGDQKGDVHGDPAVTTDVGDENKSYYYLGDHDRFYRIFS